ncbi:MAG: LEA type 2 family protein, partial [Cytophagaceae bacterium]
KDISIMETAIKNRGLELNVKINLKENGVPGFVDSISYRIEVYDVIVSEGSKRIESTKSSALVFPSKLDYRKLEQQIKKHQGEKTRVNIYIRFYSTFPLLGNTVTDVKKHADLVVPVIPEVRVTELTVTDFGLDNMQLMVGLSVSNPNNIDFILHEIDYTLDLEYAHSSGTIRQGNQIAKGSTTEISFPASLDLKHEAKGLLKILEGKRDWPYTLKTRLRLKPGQSRLHNIDINLEKQGTVNVIKGLKTAKNKEKIEVR